MSKFKQAKILDEEQFERFLAFTIQHSRTPERDRMLVLLSHKAGLRACEIARIQVRHMVDAEGRPAPFFQVFASVSKGAKTRSIPMNPVLRTALVAFQKRYSTKGHIAISTRGGRGRPRHMSANAVSVWFHRAYRAAGFQGASSHSGRRGFATELTRRTHVFGKTIVDVQQLLGHARLDTTQRYVEPSEEIFDLVASL